jgi:hypothetical protein
MKQHLFSLLIATLIPAMLLSQGKDEINFSDAVQVDSSEYFLIPRLIDEVNDQDYGKGKGYLPWGNYSDVVFYNTKTNQSKKVFFGKLAIITPFLSRTRYYNEPKSTEAPVNILPDHIIYLARTFDFNVDRALDTDDPVYLYVSSKSGDDLRQITPNGMNVLSWVISKDKKTMLIKLQADKNNNKKFGNGDDELYYRADLDKDISKITCYPITL